MLRLKFINFWNNFDPKRHFSFLFEKYAIEISDNPDFIIFSCFDDNGVKLKSMPIINSKKAARIFYTGENILPDMQNCEFAISFCHADQIQHPNHFRLPNYPLRMLAFDIPLDSLIRTNTAKSTQHHDKSNFCNFIYSNPNCHERNIFFKELSTYKPVDSMGKAFNNTGSNIPTDGNPVKNKISAMTPYKFSIAFENSSAPGYTTEKIVEAFLAETIPIYWGNPIVEREFNTKSFINFYDHDCNFEKVIKHVIETDKNEDLYMSYRCEPPLNNNTLSPYLSIDHILDIFGSIFRK